MPKENDPSSLPPEPDPGPLLARLFARSREVFEYAVHKARQLQLAQVAASLTFSSVLALVPLLAVVLALLTAFPVFGEFRDTLERELPNGILPVPYAQTILRYLADFTAKAAGVGAAGLFILALSGLSMILTVDRVLNDIWRVHRRRPLAQRLVVYWAMISVGPLLLGLSLTLTSYVMSVSESNVDHWGRMLRQGISVLSPVIAACAYSAVYALVPNRKVNWRHAVTGGVVSAAMGELLSRGFATYVIHGSLLTIYGAFAAVPVFLMWIYLSWLAFLFGAAIAATLPHLRGIRLADSLRAGDRAVTATAIVRQLLQARGEGQFGTIAASSLARQLRTDEEEIGQILLRLEQLGYARKMVSSESGAEEWVLSCDPQSQTLAPIVHEFALNPGNSLLARGDLGLRKWLSPLIEGEWLSKSIGQIAAG
jgi:membrane protein